jgi:hypothetical protein
MAREQRNLAAILAAEVDDCQLNLTRPPTCQLSRGLCFLSYKLMSRSR